MREIKFEIMFIRYKRDFSKEILKHYTTLEKLINGTDPFDYSSAELVAKRQYTGLADKNGVEIYEGDICEITDEIFSEIKFNEETASFYAASILGDSVHLYGVGLTVVIGNIYQNKELLEASND